MSSVKAVGGDVRSISSSDLAGSFIHAGKEDYEDFVFVERDDGLELEHSPAQLTSRLPPAPVLSVGQYNSLQVPALPSEIERLLEIAKSDSPPHSPAVVSVVVEQPVEQRFMPVGDKEPEKLVGLATVMIPQIEVQVLPRLTVSDTMQRAGAQSPILSPMITKQPSEEQAVPGPFEASSSDVRGPTHTDWKAFVVKAKGGFLGAVRWINERLDEAFPESSDEISPRTSTSSHEEID